MVNDKSAFAFKLRQIQFNDAEEIIKKFTFCALNNSHFMFKNYESIHLLLAAVFITCQRQYTY